MCIRDRTGAARPRVSVPSESSACSTVARLPLALRHSSDGRTSTSKPPRNNASNSRRNSFSLSATARSRSVASCAFAAAQAGRDAAKTHEATERERAVAESENEFLREFEALLRGGLDVDVRPSDEWRRANGSRATVEHALLSLGTDTRGRARCAWTVAERDTAFLVAEMRCVARPLPAELGELSARSFIVQHDGDATLVHCPSEDLADLCVAGFNLLADREVEKARANAWKKGKAPSAKKALGVSN